MERGRTLLLGKVDGVLLCAEGHAGALHVIGTRRGRYTVRGGSRRDRCAVERQLATYELAQPMRGFSQRPPPGRMSQSIRQRVDLPVPLCVVLRVGWKMRTAR